MRLMILNRTPGKILVLPGPKNVSMPCRMTQKRVFRKKSLTKYDSKLSCSLDLFELKSFNRFLSSREDETYYLSSVLVTHKNVGNSSLESLYKKLQQDRTKTVK